MKFFWRTSICLAVLYVVIPGSDCGYGQADSGVDLQPKKAWWGRWGYVNAAGKFVLEPQYEEAMPFADFLAPVKQEGKWGFINGEGKFVIEPRYEDAFLFSDQAAAVKEGGKWGFINRSGRFLVEPKYEDAAIFRQGLAAVKWEGRWGFIDKSGGNDRSSPFRTSLLLSGGSMRSPGRR